MHAPVGFPSLGSALPFVIAHRGASGYRPEHTAAAYELAIAQGADAVEPDIVSTRDGVLVLRHENEISGTTDVASRPEFARLRSTKLIDGRKVSGWFTEDFTWAELSTIRARERLPKLRSANRAFDAQQPILRLADLLEILNGSGVGLVAELKHATYFESIGLPLDELLAAELRQAGWADGSRLVVESFEQTVLEQFRGRGIDAPCVLLLEAAGSPADLVARDGASARPYSDFTTDAGLAGLTARGIAGISVEKKVVLALDAAGNAVGTSDLVSRAQAHGLLTFCWTLRAENHFLARNFRIGSAPDAIGDWRNEFLAVLATGLDGVFADQPDLAVEARAQLQP